MDNFIENKKVIWQTRSVSACYDDTSEVYWLRFSSVENVAIAYIEFMSASDEISATFTMDMQVLMIAEYDENLLGVQLYGNNENSIMHVTYNRNNDIHRFGFSIDPSDEACNDMRKLKFILGQYTFFVDKLSDAEIKQLRSPNVVARTIESGGRIIRMGLRATAEVTAKAILSAGKSYTNMVAEKKEEKQYTEEEVERAKKHQANAKWIQEGASKVAGTILYPARWTGAKGAELSKGKAMDPGAGGEVQKAVVDTVAGLGNAVSSITKGITEAIGTVGSAISESTVHYSNTKYGEDYTTNVTQRYVEAAEDIGKVGYQAANIAVNGPSGVILTAVVEGTDMAINLFEYLVGPILVQGRAKFAQLPFTSPTEYFAVLRPWSISFYNSETDITEKPNRIIATCLLDTLPKIRYDDIFNKSNVGEIKIDAKPTEQQPQVEAAPPKNDVTDDSKDDISSSSTIDAKSPSTPSRRIIELCTVDCSTFLFQPNDEDMIDVWFTELRLAAGRVETIAKRRSGAAELAEARRAKALPRVSVYHLRVLEAVVKGNNNEKDGITVPSDGKKPLEDGVLATQPTTDTENHSNISASAVEQKNGSVNSEVVPLSGSEEPRADADADVIRRVPSVMREQRTAEQQAQEAVMATAEWTLINRENLSEEAAAASLPTPPAPAVRSTLTAVVPDTEDNTQAAGDVHQEITTSSDFAAAIPPVVSADAAPITSNNSHTASTK